MRLVGLDGLIVLYREYRALTDRLFAALDIPRISIETSRRESAKYDDIIDRAVFRNGRKWSSFSARCSRNVRLLRKLTSVSCWPLSPKCANCPKLPGVLKGSSVPSLTVDSHTPANHASSGHEDGYHGDD